MTNEYSKFDRKLMAKAGIELGDWVQTEPELSSMSIETAAALLAPPRDLRAELDDETLRAEGWRIEAQEHKQKSAVWFCLFWVISLVLIIHLIAERI